MIIIIPYQFQYHTGSIKRDEQDLELVVHWACFNTTLVQLKEIYEDTSDGVHSVFQYHTGSIKSLLKRILLYKESCFNTTLVQLKALFLSCSQL